MQPSEIELFNKTHFCQTKKTNIFSQLPDRRNKCTSRIWIDGYFSICNYKKEVMKKVINWALAI